MLIDIFYTYNSYQIHVFIKDNQKLVQYYFLVIQYSNFSHFRILGSLGPQKPQVEKNTPKFIFGIIKIIGIRYSPYIRLIYSLVQNSANLCFLYLWLVARKFSSLYVSKISAGDTEPMNNNNSNNKIIILASFLEFAI